MLPRDFYEAHTIGFIRAARVYSNIVSPPVMFAVLGLAICLYTLPFWSAVGWFIVYGFWVSLFPILFVLFLLRTGRIEELHMSNTRERHLPYAVAVVGAVLVWGLATWGGAPELLRCLALFNVVELLFLLAINVFWLISLHSTGAAAVAAIIYYVWGAWWGLLIGVPLITSVCFVRLYLRRHTPAQVFMGIGLGAAVVIALHGLGCFS